MELIGKPDENFGDQGDFTGKCYAPLDFNSAAPLLQRKPVKSFSICEDSFPKLFKILESKLSETDKDNDLLVLMRIKKAKGMTSKKVSEMGWKISGLMEKDSLVVWAAQGYDRYRFDFYLYQSPEVKLRPRPDLLDSLRKG